MNLASVLGKVSMFFNTKIFPLILVQIKLDYIPFISRKASQKDIFSTCLWLQKKDSQKKLLERGSKSIADV